MALQRLVAISGVYTDLRATLPCHLMRVYENGTRSKSLTYKTIKDNFATEYATDGDPGDVIEVKGPGRQGILGRPPDYNGVGHPSVGDLILQVKTTDASSINVVVEESPDEL